jgi:hypothetical protein
MKILMVEDSMPWCEALREMYRRIFPGAEVETESRADRAIRRVRVERWDLISVDINLTMASRQEADGRDVLREAKKAKGSPGIVVCTGVHWDTDFKPHEKGDKLASLLGELSSSFPERFLHIAKPQGADPDEVPRIVKDFECNFGRTLKALVPSRKRRSVLSPPYTVQVGGEYLHDPPPDVLVYEKGRIETARRVEHSIDKSILHRLGHLRLVATKRGTFAGLEGPMDFWEFGKLVETYGAPARGSAGATVGDRPGLPTPAQVKAAGDLLRHRWDSVRRRLLALGIEIDQIMDWDGSKGIRLLDPERVFVTHPEGPGKLSLGDLRPLQVDVYDRSGEAPPARPTRRPQAL